jgi:peroxiredoxin
VTGALFLLSATAYAVRLRGSRVRQEEEKQEEEEEKRQHAYPRQVSQGPNATQTESGAAAPSPRHPEANDRGSAMTTPSTIAERVNAMHQARAAGPTGGPADTFAREQAGLGATSAAGVAPVGTVLPDASLLDPTGAAVTLSSAAGDGKSVLVFYRGAWCPYGNIALSAYQQELLPELARRGIPLVAISPQRPGGSLTMRDKHGLAFAVLSDPGNALAASLGILTEPSPEARAEQLELGLDLTEANADGTVTVPMPTVVILGPGRTVRWIDVHSDYSTRTEPLQVIDALDDSCNPGRKE